MPNEKDNTVIVDRHFYKRVLSDLYYLNSEIRALAPAVSEEFLPIWKTVKVIQFNMDALKNNLKLEVKDKAFVKDTNSKVEAIKHCNSQIINALQFQDIIEQKLQHIINVHQELIEELYREQALEKNNVEKDDLNDINKVAQINSAQLSYIINEYGEAASTIRINIKNAYKKLKEIKISINDTNALVGYSSSRDLSGFVQASMEAISLHKGELGTSSNFVIAVQMLIGVLQKLFTDNYNTPIVIEGKWKKILEMYTTQSEILVFNTVAKTAHLKNEMSLKNEEKDFELF